VTDRPDVAALLPPVEAVDALPAEVLPACALHLAALQARVAARLVASARNGNSTPKATPDEQLDIQVARALIRRSVSWMRHHGHRLPGFSQPAGKGTRVQWSRAALEIWIRGEIY